MDLDPDQGTKRKTTEPDDLEAENPFKRPRRTEPTTWAADAMDQDVESMFLDMNSDSNKGWPKERYFDEETTLYQDLPDSDFYKDFPDDFNDNDLG